jgi:hypothetical protein
MGRQAIGIWLGIALLGIVLYMLPALLKQLFFMKEQYMTRMESAKDDWKYERVSVDSFVDVPAEAAKTPDYLQNVPSDFEVGGTGGASLESQPAPVDMVIQGPTPMELQGQQMKKAPAGGAVEAFQAGPSAAPAPGSATTTGPSPAPAPGTTNRPGPSPAPATSAAPAPSCELKQTYNPNGDHIYTCDGKVVDNRGQTPSIIPKCLTSISTRDGIDEEEAAILNYCMAENNPPDFVAQLLNKNELTGSEKKALATYAKDNVKTSQQIVKPTKTSGTSSTSTSTSTSTGKTCKPKCIPKETKCGTKDSTKENEKEKEKEAKRCKGPVDMGDYIRKDSIPCWACSL